MPVIDQAGVAVLLLLLTLSLQCAGVSALITWLRSVVESDIHKRHLFGNAELVMRTTVAIIFLHGLVILLWLAAIAGYASPHGNLPFTSPQAVMRPLDMAMWFSRRSGAC